MKNCIETGANSLAGRTSKTVDSEIDTSIQEKIKKKDKTHACTCDELSTYFGILIVRSHRPTPSQRAAHSLYTFFLSSPSFLSVIHFYICQPSTRKVSACQSLLNYYILFDIIPSVEQTRLLYKNKIFFDIFDVLQLLLF